MWRNTERLFISRSRIFSWKCKLLECIVPICTSVHCFSQLLIFNSLQDSHTRLTIDEITFITNQTNANQSDTDVRVQQLLQELRAQSTLLSKLLENQASQRMPEEVISGVQKASPPAFSKSSHSGLSIRAYMPYHRQSYCRAYCRCDCHKQGTFTWVPLLKSVVGSLFIGYSGNPFRMAPRCTNVYCRTGLKFGAYVHYYFPLWFLQKVLDIEIISTIFQEPKVTLNMRGVQVGGGELFRLTLLDDARGVQQLLDRGLARPNDILAHSKQPILQVSSLALCKSKLLLQCYFVRLHKLDKFC